MTSAKEIDELRTEKGEAQNERIGEDIGLRSEEAEGQNCFEGKITGRKFEKSLLENAIKHAEIKKKWRVILYECITQYFEVNLLRPGLTVHSNRANIHQFYVLPTHCICVFCVDLRTNSDYFPIQH